MKIKQIEVGQKVVPTPTALARLRMDCDLYKQHKSIEFFVITEIHSSGKLSFSAYDKANEALGNCDGHGLVLSDFVPYKLKKSIMADIKEKFSLAFKPEPEKSFRKAGVTNGDDFLTEEGQEIFLSWLLKKHGVEFKKEVVNQLLEEKSETE